MKIHILGRVLSFEKVTPQPTMADKEDAFVEAAEKLTELWEELRLAKSKLAPWIDWKTKEIFITEIAVDRERVRK